MRLASLNEELESITRDYDYGIVPGSATIFVLDEIEALGRLDLTLLEGVMIVVEVNSQGYKITSHSPLYSGASALATTQAILAHINQPFETMENLLMTVSPMYCQRFQEVLYAKLQSVNQQQEDSNDPHMPTSSTIATTSLYPNNNTNHPSSSASFNQQQQEQQLSSSSQEQTSSLNPSLHTSTTSPSNKSNSQDNWIH
ncbi:hypothetical protein BDA99DRAFT_498602 [Phascolomyces articulosus]|uniref:GSKIP domain-containing protein n=1 Tax=Phascolomyces articulosus TaxID=60185 RepID=A0AAD5K931_9FUNG|nr:hypothetical protein BDA99DRAFT_498602 [Phascolomyces articulosus]